MRKDKKQIIGEEISDESIKLFLGVEPASRKKVRKRSKSSMRRP
ncbi:hypothetical protein ACV344_35005, partial [Pseudomonas aeruginosa]